MKYCNHLAGPPPPCSLCNTVIISWTKEFVLSRTVKKNRGCVSRNSGIWNQIKVLDVRDDGQRRWNQTKRHCTLHIDNTKYIMLCNDHFTENSYIDGGVKSPFDFGWRWRRAEGGFDWIGLARNQALRWLTEAAGETWSPCTDIDTNSSSSSLFTSLSSSLAPSNYQHHHQSVGFILFYQGQWFVTVVSESKSSLKDIASNSASTKLSFFIIIVAVNFRGCD